MQNLCCAAFSGYLGEDKQAWAEYDATELVKKGYSGKQPILIDVGTADSNVDQLQPEKFKAAASESGVEVSCCKAYKNKLLDCAPSHASCALQLIQVDSLICDHAHSQRAVSCAVVSEGAGWLRPLLLLHPNVC